MIVVSLFEFRSSNIAWLSSPEIFSTTKKQIIENLYKILHYTQDVVFSIYIASGWIRPMGIASWWQSITSWWQSIDRIFTQIDTLMFSCTLLFAIQVVFGWWRRCSSNLFIKYSLWLAYTLTPVVATYTLGFINSSIGRQNSGAVWPGDAQLLFIWSVSLVLALGGTYSMTAYDVDDNKQYTRYVIRHALYVLNTVAGARILALNTSVWVHVGFAIVLLFWPASIASTSAGMRASSFSDMESLNLQDHMENEPLMSSTNSWYDPVTLEGYNYLIFSKVKGKDITVSQIYQRDLSTLDNRRGSDGTRLKEICLSYALSRLLKRRFFGAACPEATLQKTHDFVFEGLLSNVENYQATYRVIETELAFTHDHFFTNKASLKALFILKIYFYLLVILVSWIMPVSKKDLSIITTVIMLVFFAIELLQLYVYLSSDHVRVELVSWSTTLSRGAIPLQILRACNKLPKLFGCWQNKIGQYSLLKDLHSGSIPADLMGSLSWIVGTLLRQPAPAFPRGICNPGVKGPDHIPLTYRVKKAIARTLKSSEGHLSNGLSSLQLNCEPQLSEEFLLGSNAIDLLTWHIATEYCDIAQSQQTGRQDDSVLSDHDVAARISSYCAYLMAFVPELLPDHELKTTATFQRTRKEALQNLQNEKTPKAKYAKLSGNIKGQPPPQNGVMIHGQSSLQNAIDVQTHLQDTNTNDGQLASQGDTIFNKGIQLGKRLEGITDDGRRWKILADFWTEMILYIAASDKARDHIQHLANGGEFITHLWALLTHAGILDRGQRNVANNILENPRDGPSHRSKCTTQAARVACAPNQPATTQNNHTVQLTEDSENAATNQQPNPGELSYNAASRLRHASSYLNNCREGAAFTMMRGNCVQAAGTMVRPQATLVKNVEGSSNACTAPSEIEETEQ